MSSRKREVFSLTAEDSLGVGEDEKRSEGRKLRNKNTRKKGFVNMESFTQSEKAIEKEQGREKNGKGKNFL